MCLSILQDAPQKPGTGWDFMLDSESSSYYSHHSYDTADDELLPQKNRVSSISSPRSQPLSSPRGKDSYIPQLSSPRFEQNKNNQSNPAPSPPSLQVENSFAIHQHGSPRNRGMNNDTFPSPPSLLHDYASPRSSEPKRTQSSPPIENITSPRN